MSTYIEIILTLAESEQEIWMGKLYELGFENFVEESEQLSAFISQELWRDDLKNNLTQELNKFQIKYQVIHHDSQDWNAVWESNFDPILINEELYVRAEFHPKLSSVKNEIIIAPKMAFGTGHHSTTSMILKWMTEQKLDGLDVLDFGCGTGILGIYAKIKGCKSLVMIDNEEPAVENSLEHCQMNHVVADQILLGSSEQIPNHNFDLILANITRNVLEEMLPVLQSKLKPKAKIVMSGFLESDEIFMKELANSNQLHYIETRQDKDWLMMVFEK